ncbi:MAG: hypothetical protein IPJ69_12625 [Deltaproteobacteria bacterium]|nr:MAG: hypothetical protein IPJ69_12625 [Deltaproteobacteria bacterium]
MKYFTFFLLLISFASLADAKTKYGNKAQPLHTTHSYFKSSAPDFWAIAPYYTAQQDGRSCSVATLTMLLNALRTQVELDSDTPLVTQQNLLKKLNDKNWNQNLAPLGHGVTLDEMGKLIQKSIHAYRLQNLQTSVIHISDDSQKKQLHKILIENEKSDRNFLIINFLQGRFTSDADVGHFAIIGAYDLKNRKVLIMDPDREWYEPYWVSEETLFDGLKTQDPVSKVSRGYIWVIP